MSINQSNSLLNVQRLEAGFMIDNQFHHAVDDVSFQLKPGQVVGVVGESGCGKSVMSLSIMGLLPKGIGKISSGEVQLNGVDLTKLTNKQMNNIRGKEIGMIFQEPMTALNPVFTIGYQLAEVLFNHSTISKKQARYKIIQLLKSVGISRADSIVDEYPHQLSGGMRQRVMIAMAIACEPKLLIADEPTTALDVTIQAQILELLRDIQTKSGMAMILITHDLGVVAEMADEVLVMYAGQIVERGLINQIFHDPKHPYLKLLLQSIPRLDQERERLESIQGIVPSLINMPKVGCRFADRCPNVMDECRSVTPLLSDIGNNHHVRCLLYQQSHPTRTKEATTWA
ncbi:ABC transporter ATP-binding protein [Paenibacillus albiflavus]|uniref:ABC transporter ATP-binding protein n=1 Tax=Paenibacillus albiflavus TaxID=2545760 RepID=A0A4R4E9R7_9BACL|nr:ABC transporter ATP-binding protein [Paenibacillus albiflavus]TCZ76329.1 ABC transporter ATP-binding protein [Paenibacillus albiflavus]